DLLDGPGTAATLSEALGRDIRAIVMPPDALEAAFAAGTLALAPKFEKHYAASVVENVRQIYDGRLAHIGAVTDTAQRLLGRPPVTLAQWARRNSDRF
ncbi:MAG: hypothetical protein K8S25_11935, partial [Alphaproteobacteria bacterium]|nr:hypothetical protein [Alphaproteobacteria bacterium]